VQRDREAELPDVRIRVRRAHPDAVEEGRQARVAPDGNVHAEALRRWGRQTETDVGERPGPTTDDRARLAQLERENRELRRANAILRTASAYFAQAELDRPGR
jgi:transposase